jgi:hypothetical protein
MSIVKKRKEQRYFNCIDLVSISLISVVLLLNASCASQLTTHCYNESTKNILYRGVSNPLIIDSNRKIKDIKVSHGVLEKGTKNYHYTFITEQSEHLDIEIYIQNKVEKFRFRVKDIPEPELNYGRTIVNNEIKQEDFITINSIRCHIPEVPLDIPFRIDSFEIIRITKDNTVFREYCELKKSTLIPKAEIGDMYIFKDIIIQYGDSGKFSKKSEVFQIIN